MKKGSNALFIGPGGYLSIECVKRIIKDYEVSNSYAVISNKEAYIDDFTVKIWYWDIIIGNYPKDIKCSPLDEEIISLYANKSIETLHMMDRNGKRFESYYARENLYYKHLEFWNHVMTEWNVDYVFFSTLPHEVYDFIIYQICLKRNIPTIMFYDTLITLNICGMKVIDNQGIIIKEEYQKLKEQYENKTIDNIILSEKADAFYKRLITKDEDLMPPYNFLKNQREYELKRHYYAPVKSVMKEWLSNNKSIKEKAFHILHLAKNIYGSQRNYQRGKKLTSKLVNYYDKKAVNPNLSEKFIYFALHYQPELTSSPLGGLYVNQLLPIKLLSYYLPDDVKIYVKEHPAQTCMGRNTDLYDELLKIPKVILIKQSVSSYTLVKNSIAVSSLTGTVGWEAQFFGKPFIMFGTYLSQCLEGTYKVKTNEECKNAIEEILKGHQCMTEKNLKLFIKAMDLHSFEIGSDIDTAWRYVKEIIDL